jgi:hypothetical protein
MHEYYFSLNRKCRNTHFILNEERSIYRDTNPSLTLLLPNLPRRDLSFEGKLSSLNGVVCPYSYPSPSIYRPSYRQENSLGIWESTVGPITEHHVEANGDPWRGRFGRSKGSADLAPPRLALCFLPVTNMWSLMTIPSVWVSWRKLNPCAEHVAASNLSGGASLGSMRCYGHVGHLCASTSPHVLVWVPPGPWYSVILSQLYHFMCILACPASKARNTNIVEIVSIKPYPSVDDHFPFILCRYWQPTSAT